MVQNTMPEKLWKDWDFKIIIFFTTLSYFVIEIYSWFNIRLHRVEIIHILIFKTFWEHLQ